MKTILADPEEDKDSKNKKIKKDATPSHLIFDPASNTTRLTAGFDSLSNSALSISGNSIKPNWLSANSAAVSPLDDISLANTNSLYVSGPGRGSLQFPTGESAAVYDLSGNLNNELFISKPLPQIPDKGLTKEEAQKLVERIDELEKNFRAIERQKKDTADATLKRGLKQIEERLIAGDRFEWRCAACGSLIQVFTGQTGVDEIKRILVMFGNKKLQPCRKGAGKHHLNSFEINDGSFLYHCVASFDTEIKKNKSTH